MKTPELTIERFYELCAEAKAAASETMVGIRREELWALVDLAKQLHEYKRAEEDKRFEARTTDTEE